MTTALEGDEGSASRPGRSLPPEEARRVPGPVWTAENLAPPPGFDPRTVQPVANRYTDWVTRPIIRTGKWTKWPENGDSIGLKYCPWSFNFCLILRGTIWKKKMNSIWLNLKQDQTWLCLKIHFVPHSKHIPPKFLRLVFKLDLPLYIVL